MAGIFNVITENNESAINFTYTPAILKNTSPLVLPSVNVCDEFPFSIARCIENNNFTVYFWGGSTLTFERELIPWIVSLLPPNTPLILINIDPNDGKEGFNSRQNVKSQYASVSDVLTEKKKIGFLVVMWPPNCDDCDCQVVSDIKNASPEVVLLLTADQGASGSQKLDRVLEDPINSRYISGYEKIYSQTTEIRNPFAGPYGPNITVKLTLLIRTNSDT